MVKGTKRGWAYGAAAALALLTFTVFFLLQDYGPESAIRRFHAAVLRGDAYDLQRVTQQNFQSPNVQLLCREVRFFASMGTYQLVKMERAPNQVRAAVVYRRRGTREFYPMIWVVENRGSVWKVDADKTATIQRNFDGS